jgi:micrococcal nuclease
MEENIIEQKKYKNYKIDLVIFDIIFKYNVKKMFSCCFFINNTNNTLNNEDNDAIQFIPPITSGLVIKVYDGDTITIVAKLPYKKSPLYKFSVRLNGINCPEIKGENDDEKQCAQLAKKELEDLILNKQIILKNLATEKYGRILADVYLDDLHLNKHMLDKRLAVCYDGGKKNKPESWLRYHHNT